MGDAASPHATNLVDSASASILDPLAFDVVLMDVQMPEMDGLEAVGRLRAWEQQVGGHIPVVAMTAYAMSGDRDKCLASGMDDYVAKPIQPDELFAALARLTATALPEIARVVAAPRRTSWWTWPRR